MEKQTAYLVGKTQKETKITTPEVPWELTPGRVPLTFVTYMMDRYLELVYQAAYNRRYHYLDGQTRYWTRAMLADACRREVGGVWQAAGRELADLVTSESVRKTQKGKAQAELDYQKAEKE